MKKTLKIELPDQATLVAGLAPREVHPPLARAEQVAIDAEAVLARRRAELANREETVAELPLRINRGEAKTSALTDALRERDAAALLVAPAEQVFSQAKERVARELKIANVALGKERARRAELLERIAAELAPVLDEIDDLAIALSKASGASGLAIDWPCSPSCRMGKVHNRFAAPPPPPIEVAK